jgi:uncharacterized SAM-binding protein YcdF (DUF218 family)
VCHQTYFYKKTFIEDKIKICNMWQMLQKLALSLCAVLGIWLIFITITLLNASSSPVDGFFVLGGSITREIYVAQEAKKSPSTPILISRGSQDPCIRLIFQREVAPIQNVWLEHCADSTFENFYYAIPILRRLGVHKVMLITSPTHLPRAKWLGQILLGSHGIWVEPVIVQEKGIPGNRESWLKTGADITRSLFWAGLSQFIQPECSNVTRLPEVNMQNWQQRGFRCERQGNLGR